MTRSTTKRRSATLAAGCVAAVAGTLAAAAVAVAPASANVSGAGESQSGVRRPLRGRLHVHHLGDRRHRRARPVPGAGNTLRIGTRGEWDGDDDVGSYGLRTADTVCAPGCDSARHPDGERRHRHQSRVLLPGVLRSVFARLRPARVWPESTAGGLGGAPPVFHVDRADEPLVTDVGTRSSRV